jgi:GxxExxY protein
MTQIDSGAAQDRADRQTYAIIGAAMEVHRHLGAGFLEPVYQEALAVEFDAQEIPNDREVELPIRYKRVVLGSHYRVDFVCFGNVLVEIKALARLSRTEESQIINYLTASRLPKALLLNFGSSSLQYRRFVGPCRQRAFQSVPSV